jgi:hypothetical protein
MADPPLDDGADQETVTLVKLLPFPLSSPLVLVVTAVTPVGDPGTSAVLRESDALDALEVPVAFVAVTVKV